jgi:hypothetical protein
MARPTYNVNAYFDLPSTGGLNIFTLDHPVKGILDSAYVLAGDIATDISIYVRSISINRGRSRQFDEIATGTCVIELGNRVRTFDPFNASGPFYGNIKTGKRFTVLTSGFAIFDGFVESYRYKYGRNSEPVAVVTLVDALAVLAQKEFDVWTATAGQTVGQRLTTMLNRNEVVFPSMRAFDAGVSTLQADVVAAGTNVLAYAQLLAKSDLGRFFAARDGVLTFVDRRRNLNAGPAVTFINDGSGIVFADLERSTGDELLYNRVSAGRRGGTTEVFEDTASIDEYGIHNYTVDDLLLETDAQAYDYGLFIASNYSQPEERFSSFTIAMDALNPSMQGLFASLDIGSLVRGVYDPGVGTPLDRYCIVEGFKHDLQRNKHLVTVFVGDAINRSAFILDDPVFGVLDGPGILVF